MSRRITLSDIEIEAIIASIEYSKETLLSSNCPNGILGNYYLEKLIKKLIPKEK